MWRRIAVTVLAAAGLALWSLTTGAQVIEGDGCRQACFAQKSECVSACGTHSNPIECEADCRDALNDCLDRC